MYTVIWAPNAVHDLARLWQRADAAQRDRITLASNQIDLRLRRNPQQDGESRDRGRRILLIPPLGVLYRVFEDDKLVRVVMAWEFKTRSA